MSNTDNDYHYSEEEQQHHDYHYSEEEHHQDSGEDFNDHQDNEEEQHLYEEDYSEYQRGLDLHGGDGEDYKEEEQHQDYKESPEANEDQQEGRFTYGEISNYLHSHSYPLGFSKADKLALRKRSKFFALKDGQLHYTGKGT